MKKVACALGAARAGRLTSLCLCLAAGVGGCGGSTGGSPVDGAQDFITAQCARPAGQPLVLTSIDQMRATLQGRWGLCEPPDLFGGAWPGLVIDGDDRWAFLTASDGGGLAREHGITVEGAVVFGQDATSGAVTVQFGPDSTDRVLDAQPTITNDPRILIVGRGPGATARYVALPPGSYEVPDAGPAAVDAPVDAPPDEASSRPDGGGQGAPCRTGADCAQSYQCFIQAAATACPATPTGVCSYAPGGNCSLSADHCACFKYGPLMPDCSAFPNTICDVVSGDGGGRCATCMPASSTP